VVIGRRRRRPARLVELPAAERPPILRAHVLRSGRRQPNSSVVEREAWMFFGVSGDPSLGDLASIAEFYPVFRVVTDY
jgi:hypothetical protein